MNLPVIDGGFGCIMADPPWYFRSYAAVTNHDNSSRAIEKHYSTMNLRDIMAMPVRDVAARDAHLFLWATGPCLPQAFEVIKAWGFRYSGMGFVWIKQRRALDPRQLRMIPTAESDLHVGLGFTTRKNAEYVLLARRGNAKRVAKNVREVILSPAREHSRKPDEAYARVERYCAGPYLELFGRQSRPGWTVWGNEATKFDTAAE
jgi:N6-adenosine-specific RNA methylase IME4